MNLFNLKNDLKGKYYFITVNIYITIDNTFIAGIIMPFIIRRHT